MHSPLITSVPVACSARAPLADEIAADDADGDAVLDDEDEDVDEETVEDALEVGARKGTLATNFLCTAA